MWFVLLVVQHVTSVTSPLLFSSNKIKVFSSLVTKNFDSFSVLESNVKKDRHYTLHYAGHRMIKSKPKAGLWHSLQSSPDEKN